jgi:uncharacterized protein (DUF305 family)
MRPATALLLLALAACSTHKEPPLLGGAPAIGNRPQDRPPSPADIHFMSGMIPHHAQAVKISRWAATHGASQSIKALTERIVVGQGDEIAIMQTWLRDRGQKVPAADATHLRMNMNGMEHDMLMPGMLTDEELAELEGARGVDFDRLFLRAMIKHHMGAIEMVNELFASRSAAQDDVIFKFASDVYADQTTEIERMQKMLDALPPSASRAP